MRQTTDISQAKPLISVIMPCYNSAHIIEKTIANLYQQTFDNFELVVVDDGSLDNSLEVLQKITELYKNIKIISQQNKGPGPARNRGLGAASGEFIAFLDSDDSWHPEFLAKLHHKLKENPNCVLAYCGWQNIGLNAEQCQPYIPPDYEENDKFAVLLHSCPWPIHAALTRKFAIDQVGGFNEHWLTAEDFDMWIRIAMFANIVRVPEVLAYYHHQQGEQISSNRLRAILNHWGVQKGLLHDFPEISQTLGKAKTDLLTKGQLLQRAYEFYWKNDLPSAHHLFRKALGMGYFGTNDLKYILPSLLPLTLYRALIKKIRS
ncbi:glycosyltransferase [Methylomonas sp. MO1]|uniref:glycosyltransferase family 2 protein n=1 Tax=unclassified Methylomonas TaxID=2608980 RepID=UPI000479B5B6|nr:MULTISPECIES: glycosyltransferase [unclassified Methylomonas]MDT4292318.1 glycosyltransferase [Methylomonas sp. MO1]